MTYSLLGETITQKAHGLWLLLLIAKVTATANAVLSRLVNQEGEQLGVLSGGCLEADIRLMARKCLSLQKVLTKEYDGRDETDASYQMGCGGIVWIKFIPLNDDKQSLKPRRSTQRLRAKRSYTLWLRLRY